MHTDSSTPTSRNPFAALGLHGLERIAPVLLAALATEEPLLLIGPHGTAKTLLLTRIAGALGMSFRHYNASLLNFDDLVGFPLPGKDGQLDYIKTPAAIWGAGAVIFDEISRCRPDIQNKLFPIIHERKVQGLSLSDLHYRWAAMNPPSTDDNDNGYSGSEPLDTALADRFAFIVEMPEWTQLTEAEQLAVIRATDFAPSAEAVHALQLTLTNIRASIPTLQTALAPQLANYVRSVLALLSQAGIHLSPRRGGMLFRSILAVQAASLSTAPETSGSDITLLALRCSLPQRAQGVAFSETKLLAAHREAWHLVQIGTNDMLRAILLTADPLERIHLAMSARSIRKGEFSSIIADSLAQLSVGARDGAIVRLFETNAAGRLNAAIAEHVAERYQGIVLHKDFSEALYASSPRFITWNRIKDLLSKLDPTSPADNLRANALAAAFARKELSTANDADLAFYDFRLAYNRLQVA